MVLITEATGALFPVDRSFEAALNEPPIKEEK
jgi:hypothetical protein